MRATIGLALIIGGIGLIYLALSKGSVQSTGGPAETQRTP